MAMEGVRSAVSGTGERIRRKMYEATGLNQVFDDVNVHLVIKSSPEKTALALAPLASKQGRVVKLNDTGRWRERQAFLVPHTFLYYFCPDRNPDLRPHGVIDLEYYTSIKVSSDNIVTLAPSDDTLPIRTFHFRFETRKEADSWANAIRDTRYGPLHDERNALEGVKTILTEQVATLTDSLRLCNMSLEASRRSESTALSELAHCRSREARRTKQIEALLAESIPSDGRPRRRGARDMSSDGDIAELAALGEALTEQKRENNALKTANASLVEQLTVATEVKTREAMEASAILTEERDRTRTEVAIRHQLEEEIRCLRQQLLEKETIAQEARANVGVVAATCREAEGRVIELQEHRRVLAREVKSVRAENRRLSAALDCATTAVATTAAAAAATAAVTSKTNKKRSSEDMMGDEDSVGHSPRSHGGSAPNNDAEACKSDTLEDSEDNHSRETHVHTNERETTGAYEGDGGSNVTWSEMSALANHSSESTHDTDEESDESASVGHQGNLSSVHCRLFTGSSTTGTMSSGYRSASPSMGIDEGHQTIKVWGRTLAGGDEENTGSMVTDAVSENAAQGAPSDGAGCGQIQDAYGANLVEMGITRQATTVIPPEILTGDELTELPASSLPVGKCLIRKARTPLLGSLDMEADHVGRQELVGGPDCANAAVPLHDGQNETESRDEVSPKQRATQAHVRSEDVSHNSTANEPWDFVSHDTRQETESIASAGAPSAVDMSDIPRWIGRSTSVPLITQALDADASSLVRESDALRGGDDGSSIPRDLAAMDDIQGQPVECSVPVVQSIPFGGKSQSVVGIQPDARKIDEKTLPSRPRGDDTNVSSREIMSAGAGASGAAAIAATIAAAEAAAAARRWEARLKGSFKSMTENVRWGMS